MSGPRDEADEAKARGVAHLRAAIEAKEKRTPYREYVRRARVEFLAVEAILHDRRARLPPPLGREEDKADLAARRSLAQLRSLADDLCPEPN